MTKLTRFFASLLLIVSISAVAIADGGSTQGPSIYSEPPPATAPDAVSAEDPSSSVLDALKTAESVAVWLITEVF
jgi:hypothetical protein